MSYRTFLTYSVLGGTAWIWSMLFVGYFLGRYVPGIDRHIEKVIIVVIFLSILPGIIGWLRNGKREPGTAATGNREPVTETLRILRIVVRCSAKARCFVLGMAEAVRLPVSRSRFPVRQKLHRQNEPWPTHFRRFPTPSTRSSRTSTRRRWRSITASITRRTSTT